MRSLVRAGVLLFSVVPFIGCEPGTAFPTGDETAGEAAELSSELKPKHVKAGKELFVTDLSVVEDPVVTRYTPGKWNTDYEGAFSFGRLIDNLNRDEKPTDTERSRFVMKWLLTWETPQVVNGLVLPARPKVRDLIITPWKLGSVGRNGNKSSDCTASPDTDFRCKLSFDEDVIPFRLLAIVYRPDLRVVPRAGVPGSAGQGRFVFGILDAGRNPMLATVIFEYMIPVSGADGIQATAEEYAKLRNRKWGEDYNKELASLTIDFTKWNIAPDRQNGSALLQIRTNELNLSPAGADPSNPTGLMWELREFILGPDGDLKLDPVKQEPRLELNASPALVDWVNQNASAIVAGTADMPTWWQGAPLLAASSLTPFSGFSWTLPGVAPEVRNAFALNTCNGCHRAETGTNFLHVRNRAKGVESVLSPTLAAELSGTGIRVADYVHVIKTDFEDLEDGPGKDRGRDRSRR